MRIFGGTICSQSNWAGWVSTMGWKFKCKPKICAIICHGTKISNKTSFHFTKHMSKRRGDPPASSRKELRHGSRPATGVELGIGIISSGTGKFSVCDGVMSVSDWALVGFVEFVCYVFKQGSYDHVKFIKNKWVEFFCKISNQGPYNQVKFFKNKQRRTFYRLPHEEHQIKRSIIEPSLRLFE